MMGDEEKVGVEEVEEEAAAPVEEAKPKADVSKIIKILIYVVGAILLVFLMIGISYMVTKFMQEKKYEKEQDIIVAPPPPAYAHFDISPAFSVSTRDAEPHFMKITISLAYEGNPELGMELSQRLVQMQHILNLMLGSKSYEDLNDLEDKTNLAEEIKAHINAILAKGKIKEVYFKEFILN